MSITYKDDERLFTITTAHTSYQMGIDPLGHLLHLYYGRRAGGFPLSVPAAGLLLFAEPLRNAGRERLVSRHPSSGI